MAFMKANRSLATRALSAGGGGSENDQPRAAHLRCDPCLADPVLRNDIRVIAAGNGCTDDLQLEHLPANTDIRVGDVLVTSGLGGRFPEGYPVGVVSLGTSGYSACIHGDPGPVQPPDCSVCAICCCCGAPIATALTR